MTVLDQSAGRKPGHVYPVNQPATEEVKEVVLWTECECTPGIERKFKMSNEVCIGVCVCLFVCIYLLECKTSLHVYTHSNRTLN